MDEASALKAFFKMCNWMTDVCFNSCIEGFNHRHCSDEENRCIDACTTKLIYNNHRIGTTYAELYPKIMERRMEDTMKQMAEVEKQQAAQATAEATTEVNPSVQ